MSATKGYYSVIQYCPDRSRMEAANVGVLLMCPDIEFVSARTASGNDRVSKFFGRDSFDSERLNAAKRSIQRRLEVDPESFRTVDDLVRFVDVRGNDILLTPPRPMKVVDPEADLDLLFEELVGGRSRRPRKPPEIPELDQVFRQASLQDRIFFDQVVSVPVLDRPLQIPYAYRNGVLNLVKPQRFSAQSSKATTKAMELAIEGDLLKRHAERNESRKLIVVSVFEGRIGADELRERVGGVLREYEIRVVHEDQITSFAEEVEKQAH